MIHPDSSQPSRSLAAKPPAVSLGAAWGKLFGICMGCREDAELDAYDSLRLCYVCADAFGFQPPLRVHGHVVENDLAHLWVNDDLMVLTQEELLKLGAECYTLAAQMVRSHA